MSAKRIAIIGGGNLGSAIAQGVLKSGFASGSDIIITKRNVSTLADLQKLGVQTETARTFLTSSMPVSGTPVKEIVG